MRWALCATLLVAVPAGARPLPAAPRAAAAPALPAAAPPLPLAPEERLAMGRQAYLNNDFAATVAAVRELLYPEVRLRSEEEVQAAHRLLALSYFLSRKYDEAEREFSTLLALRPDFALDPVVDPPQAIVFLDKLRGRERQRLEDFERRRRAEAEAAAREEEQRRKAEEDRRIQEGVERELKARRPTIEKHQRFISFVPFGAGQFQNGQAAKGRAFLGTQVTLAVLEIGLWVGLEARYNFGRVPRQEVDLARGLQITAVVVGGLFWADVAWGIIDALVHYQPEVMRTAPPQKRLSLGPFVPPGGGGGLSLQGAF